jgi:hypothetical protein
MALQESLAKVQEFNAAIELPHSGLLGIKAYLRERSPTTRIVDRIEACLALSDLAERSLTGDQNAARQDIHLYTAIRSLFMEAQAKENLLRVLKRTKIALNALLAHLNHLPGAAEPSTDELAGLVSDLETLAHRIRHGIPREEHLASIVGGPYSGPGLARS